MGGQDDQRAQKGCFQTDKIGFIYFLHGQSSLIFLPFLPCCLDGPSTQ